MGEAGPSTHTEEELLHQDYSTNLMFVLCSLDLMCLPPEDQGTGDGLISYLFYTDVNEMGNAEMGQQAWSPRTKNM